MRQAQAQLESSWGPTGATAGLGGKDPGLTQQEMQSCFLLTGGNGVYIGQRLQCNPEVLGDTAVLLTPSLLPEGNQALERMHSVECAGKARELRRTGVQISKRWHQGLTWRQPGKDQRPK